MRSAAQSLQRRTSQGASCASRRRPAIHAWKEGFRVFRTNAALAMPSTTIYALAARRLNPMADLGRCNIVSRQLDKRPSVAARVYTHGNLGWSIILARRDAGQLCGIACCLPPVVPSNSTTCLLGMSTIKKNLKAAREALSKQEYREALQHCKSALKEDPASYDACLYAPTRPAYTPERAYQHLPGLTPCHHHSHALNQKMVLCRYVGKAAFGLREFDQASSGTCAAPLDLPELAPVLVSTCKLLEVAACRDADSRNLPQLVPARCLPSHVSCVTGRESVQEGSRCQSGCPARVAGFGGALLGDGPGGGACRSLRKPGAQLSVLQQHTAVGLATL
jgi:hypothetical protein